MCHRQVAAMNKLSDKVSVVQKDIALLERGKHVRYLGANLAIGDIFDAGMLALNCVIEIYLSLMVGFWCGPSCGCCEHSQDAWL